MKISVSDEQLNAFVDDELDVFDKDSLFIQLETDTVLKQSVCELNAVKALMRHAYITPPTPLAKAPRWQLHRPTALVASIMLVAGFDLGWLGHGAVAPVTQLGYVPPGIVKTDLHTVSLAGVAPDANKIVLHIDSADPAKFQRLLNDVDYLAQQHATAQSLTQIEVLASNNGLSMLRAGFAPYPALVATLMKDHSNVRFVACNQTLQRLRKEGADVQLLPDVQVIPTATGEVVNRLQDGWTYIKV